MKKIVKLSLAVAMVSGIGAVNAQAADDGINILSDVNFKGQIRPRYQYTDHDNGIDGGHSFTTRTNLSVNAKLLGVDGLGTTIELNSVNDYSTLDANNVDLAGEAAVAKVSQANVTYTRDGITGVIGRMTTNLDNQRFVGSVGWKQNFQTLDLAGVIHRGDKLEYTVAYVYGVNAIGDAGNGTASTYYTGGTTSGETRSAVANVSYEIIPEAKVTGYAYLLGSHSDTYGLSLTGKADLGAKVSYRAEYAILGDASLETKDLGKPNQDASYMNLDISANISGILVGAEYELQSGTDGTDGKTTFVTPLATKHAFNGWADKFLVTPAAGLEDINLMVGYKSKDIGTVKAVYHMFSSDVGSIDYGSELDLLYTKKIASNVTGMVKAAFYTADSSTEGAALGGTTVNIDTTKIWLMADYRF